MKFADKFRYIWNFQWKVGENMDLKYKIGDRVLAKAMGDNCQTRDEIRSNLYIGEKEVLIIGIRRTDWGFEHLDYIVQNAHMQTHDHSYKCKVSTFQREKHPMMEERFLIGPYAFWLPEASIIRKIEQEISKSEISNLGRFLSGIDKYKDAIRDPNCPFKWL